MTLRYPAIYDSAKRNGLLGVWLVCAYQHGLHKPAPGPCPCPCRPYIPRDAHRPRHEKDHE